MQFAHTRQNVVANLIILFTVLCAAILAPTTDAASAASVMTLRSPESAVARSSQISSDNPSPATDDDETSSVRIVYSDAQGIVLALTIPPYQIQEITATEPSCYEISVPIFASTGMPGGPHLPVIGTMLGIPYDTPVSLQIIDAESAILPIHYDLCTTFPQLVDQEESVFDFGTDTVWTRIEDPQAPQSSTLYPEEVASLTTGIIRGQRVAQVEFHPFLYNAGSQQIKVYNDILVRLSFNATSPTSRLASGEAQSAQPSPYEAFLRETLINYGTATAWRQLPDNTNYTVPVAALSPLPTSMSSPAFRIQTTEQGWHTVTYEDLAAAAPNLDLDGINAANFHVWHLGNEVAVGVTQQQAGEFAPGDEVRFYADSLDTVYTDVNVYWLTWDTTQGLRITEIEGTPTGTASVPREFLTTKVIEENTRYSANYFTSDGDHWHWEKLTSTGSPVTGTYGFLLENPATVPTTATLTGRLVGLSASPHHATEVQINGHFVYSNTWPSKTEHVFTTTIPTSILASGTNTISVAIGTDNSSGNVYVNRFALTYSKTYTATNNRLLFEGDLPGTWEFQISGFTTDSVRIFDVTNPNQVAEIVGSTAPGHAGSTSVAFEHQIDGEHHYLAIASDQWLTPTSIELDIPSDLTDTSQQADYVVIAHSDFLTAAHTLVQHRHSQGLEAMVVDVQDIYDEFNYGITDAEAVRDFLKYAYDNWQPPTMTYVVLLGDGNYDPKGYLSTTAPAPTSYIPPYLADVDPRVRETAADERYVCMDGADDQLADVFLGRLAVGTAEEAEALVAKLIAYDSGEDTHDWQERVLFVADNEDPPENYAGDFAAYSDAVADSENYLPSPYQAEKIYHGVGITVTHDVTSSSQAAILASIDQGQLIVNYVGHAAIPYWASEKLFSIDDALVLTNTGKLPLIVAMTCQDGYYIRPQLPDRDYSAMGEAITRLPTTGAIASWSATGYGLASGHDYLNRALFEAIFQKDIIELGPATTYAKLYLYSETGTYFDDLLDTYLLFGDPATKLQVLPVDVQIETAVAGGQTAFTSGDTITYTLTYTNSGPATAHNVQISDTLPTALVSASWTASGAEAITQTGTTYTWNVADLPAGTGGVITVTGTITGMYDGLLDNAAEITTTSVDGDTLNNRSSANVLVAQITTDLEIKLKAQSEHNAALLRPGEALTYTLAYTNTGPDTARDVNLTSTLPEHFTDTAISQNGATATQQPGSRYIWDIADLPPDGGGTITIAGVVDQTLYSGSLTHTATITTSSVVQFADRTADTLVLDLKPYQVYMPVVLKR